LVQKAAVPRDIVSPHCYRWYNRLQYQGTQSHLTTTAGTIGCSTKGLSLTSLLQLVQQAAVPRDLVSPYCYSWYNRLQYQGTQSHLTATAGTKGCSPKALSLTSLLQLVQKAAVPRHLVSPHCYSWYNRLQCQGT
jgi:hypothetical protein